MLNSCVGTLYMFVCMYFIQVYCVFVHFRIIFQSCGPYWTSCCHQYSNPVILLSSGLMLLLQWLEKRYCVCVCFWVSLCVSLYISVHHMGLFDHYIDGAQPGGKFADHSTSSQSVTTFSSPSVEKRSGVPAARESGVRHQVWYVCPPTTNVHAHAEERSSLDGWLRNEQEGNVCCVVRCVCCLFAYICTGFFTCPSCEVFTVSLYM